MRKALVIGIDHYEHAPPLRGCVNDALAVQEVLETHGNGEPNFSVRTRLGRADGPPITRVMFKRALGQLFEDDPEIALFYFAGHGDIEITGGDLLLSDFVPGGDGFPLNDVLTLANQSRARNKIIMLDSCHSGFAGTPPGSNRCEISEGLTVLTAATAEQKAREQNGHGVFTGLMLDALRGAAANLVGDVTPGSLYSHIDQSLGPWEQRPVFKTNIKSFVSLRKVSAPVTTTSLRSLKELFPDPEKKFPLDESFEPERPLAEPVELAPDPENTRIFALLQKFNRVNLVVPVDAPHMFQAAIHRKACRLTPLGKHYHRLATRGLI